MLPRTLFYQGWNVDWVINLPPSCASTLSTYIGNHLSEGKILSTCAAKSRGPLWSQLRLSLKGNKSDSCFDVSLRGSAGSGWRSSNMLHSAVNANSEASGASRRQSKVAGTVWRVWKHIACDVSIFVQEDAGDVESKLDCKKQPTDPIQELSLLQFLKSKSFALLFPVCRGPWRLVTVNRGHCDATGPLCWQLCFKISFLLMLSREMCMWV